MIINVKTWNKKLLIISAVLFALFALLTVLVGKVDVATVFIEAAEGVDCEGELAEIGFSTLNLWIRSHFLYSDLFYKITTLTGYAAVGVCVIAFILGLTQWISYKSLLKVDPDVIKLGVVFAIALCFYFAFDKLVTVNVRPWILDAEDGLDNSYPSSHTLLALVGYLCSLRLSETYFKGFLKNLVRYGVYALTFVTVFGRFLSGAHWATDIIASLLLGAALICLYYGLCGEQREYQPEEKKA